MPRGTDVIWLLPRYLCKHTKKCQDSTHQHRERIIFITHCEHIESSQMPIAAYSSWLHLNSKCAISDDWVRTSCWGLMPSQMAHCVFQCVIKIILSLLGATTYKACIEASLENIFVGNDLMLFLCRYLDTKFTLKELLKHAINKKMQVSLFLIQLQL